MRNSNHNVTTTVSRIAAVIAVIVTLAMPVGYYALSSQYQLGAMHTETEIKALLVTQVVNDNPDYWRYQGHRLVELMHEDISNVELPEFRYIRDLEGAIIAQGNTPPASPLMSVSEPIYDAGHLVAYMVTERSLRPVLLHTAIVALLGLVLGASVFFTLQRLPLRALNRALADLRSSDERFSKAFNVSPELIAIVRVSDTRIIDANASFIRMTGRDRDAVIGSALSDLQLIVQDTEVAQLLQKGAAAQSIRDAECLLHASSGELRNVLISSESIRLDEEPCILITARDVTTLKHAEQRLAYLANFDTLTGLPNRALFHDRLTQAMHRAVRNQHLVALMFLDLDRFKNVNDSLGQEAGDCLLVEVAGRLSEALRDSDTIARGDTAAFSLANATVARLGGDKFTVVLETMRHVEFAAIIAQKILNIFEKPFSLQDCDIYMTASIGISIYPLDDDDIDELIKHADTAMYHAKKMGRNNFQSYGEHLNAQTRERLLLGTALHQALEHQEFMLHYQPKLDLKNNRITGVEALLRWQHPQRGLLPPLEFISLLEDNGLIVPVGEWVIRTACVQAMRWRESGLPPLVVAVNLSPRQFRQGHLIQRIQHILQETGLEPCYLELEITEGLLLDNSEFNLAILSELKGMGVSIAIDDFGTGYSSLSYLKRFPIDVLKIDRVFVSDITANRDDAAIANAVIALGKSMHLLIVAEGVETEIQLNYLRDMGCDLAQGFLLSQPLVAEAFEAWWWQQLEITLINENIKAAI